MNVLTRPVWAEINLDHLAHNIREVRRLTREGTMVTAVIKADGYGHGAVQIGQTLLDNGADRFAVATLSEAISLKAAFPNTEVMVLGYTPNEMIDAAIEKGLIVTVYSLVQAEWFNHRASTYGKKLKIHVKLDTGMRRIGMEINEQTVSEIIVINQLAHLELEGLFTHFAVADEVDKAFTRVQVQKFLSIASALESKEIRIPIKHVSNSAAIIDLPEYNFDMVRAGIMLYGLWPSPDVLKDRVELREVMSLKANIAHVKTIQTGEGVSYGLKFKADKPTRIATLPIGYADGFSRSFTFKAKGSVNGTLKPIVGRICMDQCMLEVDGLDVKVGDTVTLFGEGSLGIDDYASMLGTINYEIVCMIGKRVPRRYVTGGETVLVNDMVLDQK